MIADRSESLVAECANCVGLCCVALAFTRSEDFAFSKGDDEECRNLERDYRCSIHSSLRQDGMKGCTVFDCHGAGQRVTQSIYGGASWRDSVELRTQMFGVFRVARQLHEMLWYLAAAARANNDGPTGAAIEAVYASIEEASMLPGDRVLELDLEDVRGRVNPLLEVVSESTREHWTEMRDSALPGKARAGADLVGVGWSGRDLRGADLRGALLIAADLSTADLRGADLIAADLRDADLGGADLSTALFVTQMQLNAARGDRRTLLPSGTIRPSRFV